MDDNEEITLIFLLGIFSLLMAFLNRGKQKMF